MSMDLGVLLERDHRDLERGLDALLRPGGTVTEIRTTLDGVRLGLTAHAEAEDIVLYVAARRSGSNSSATATLEALVSQARAAHLAQEKALASLVCSPPGSALWHDRALMLRRLVHEHAELEEQQVLPAFRALVPREAYDALAGKFATERLRQLAMLQPSAPIVIADLACAS